MCIVERNCDIFFRLYFAVSDQHLADGEVKKQKIPLNIDTNMLKIGFLGGGKMAQALAKGFIRAGK